MRVACSIFVSALMVYPSFGQSPGQPTQQTKDQPPSQKPETVSLKQPLAFGLEDGTPIKLRLTRNLSSADATTGDRVDFEVLEDVKVKDVIVVPRGGLALATVTEAQHKRRMARGGKLDVNVDDVRLLDGEKAPEITAYINGDIPLDPVRFKKAEVKPTIDATVAPGSTAPATSVDSSVSSVDVKSSPDGAEITIDDKYMGSTPSTLKLTPGDHKIRLEKSGF